MNRILVTGATGFIGSHFCDFLLQNNLGEVHAIKRYRSPVVDSGAPGGDSGFKFHDCNLLDFSSVYKIIDEVRPDYIFHFAAQSSVGSSWKYPIATLMDNSMMQANILEALRLMDLTPKIWIAGTSEEYGATRLDDLPIKEEFSLQPLNPYAVSKATQEMMALQYGASHGMRVFIARSFNIEGPRRPDAFVISSFAKQIARIEKYKLEPIIKVGNLAARRDFVDVRDAVRGYWLMTDSGKPLTPYNVASGKSHSIQEVLDTLIGFSKVKLTVQQDPNLMRPNEILERIGDSTRLQALGWRPEFAFEKTLYDTVDYWRKHV